MSPYPGAKFNWIEDDKKSIIKILKAEVVKENHPFDPKKVIVKDHKILITHATGFLNCIILQFPNKKQMKAIDLLNGNRFSDKVQVS